MSDRLPDVCSNCGTELQDEIAGESTQPCPKCGSTKRTHQLQIQPGHMQLTGSEVELKVIRAWDSNSLTLDAVIYGIVVTVIGVVIATFGTLPTFIYAVVVLVLLAAGVLLWAQPILRAMRGSWSAASDEFAVARGLRAT
jgi:membrane protein YdbS with pleckstrin-like domain